ncbi:MAG: filamentous hemagglutinin N-terminal domain-containing protein [Cyanobacteriota bacterium]|nr:filamentous hemagglutinin N-terminal domain-containing protein [Cyanobacteriota bacterium]
MFRCAPFASSWIVVLVTLSGASPAIAQLIPDGTLGTESSIVTPLDALNDRIDGGAVRGGNLFHSFGEFNIDTGRGAFFDNPAAVDNILTRVTGGNPSNIFGTLGVLGDANLFLVNPSGIVFGPEARLDVGGSFFASTAGGILFPDGYEFSATNPDAPPLLTVNVPIGLQFGANPGGIINQSVATNDAGEVRGLSVPSGETLALVGGNVTLDGGNVQPRGGRVELGGLAGVGTVGVNADGSLSFPDGVERADVSLGNAADVNVRAGGGGEIAINTGNFQMSGGSTLRAGIESGMGAPDAQAGDISIDATQSIFLSETSQILNGVLSADSIGNAGDIDIATESLFATGNSGIVTFTDGLGNGGAITVRATDTRLETDSIFQSGIFSEGVGNAGDIDISTGSLNITSGGGLNAFTQGTGNAGNIGVRADSVSVDGFTTSPDGSTFFSGIQSSVDAGGVGNAGDVEISANSVSLSNRAVVGSSTSARGDGGRVSIRAETVTFDSGSEVQNQVFPTAVGNSGGIEIVTGSLFINNGSRLISDTFGRGNAGKIEIRATDTVVLATPLLFDEADRSAISAVVGPDAVGNSQGLDITTESLILRNAFLGSSTLGRGDAGQITIQATEIISDNTNISSFVGPEAIGNSQGIEITTGSLSFSNSSGGIATFTSGEGNAGNISIRATDSVSLNNANISSTVTPIGETEAIGEGGDISITARTLSLNDASLLAGTLGQGDAGNILVRVADSVTVTGSLGFSTAVLDEGVGQGGDIEIETGDLFLGEGTSLLALTDARGDAGRMRIRARDSVTLDGSFILTDASANAVGNAQGIEITTNRLSLSNGAVIGGRSIGDGNAGQIDVNANRIRLDDSSISALTFGGEGNITLNSQELVLRNNSEIDTDAFGTVTGGNIEIKSDVIAALENSDITANAQEAFGGRVTIDTQGLFGTAFRDTQTPESDITATSELGPDFSGTVAITPPEVDPASGLVGLPDSPVDAASLLGKDFCSQRGNSEFIITGRGGFPPNPRDILPGSSIVEIDWVELPDETASAVESTGDRPPTPTENPPLIEAQGWIADESGNIILTAQPYRGTPNPTALRQIECQDGDRLRAE